MNVEMAMKLHHQNASMGWRNVHLSGGRLLNVRRVSMSPTP
jgi:hypothetical protein